jgi:hypothetical protein
MKIDRLIYKLEDEIFDKIGLNPDEVTADLTDFYPSTHLSK